MIVTEDLNEELVSYLKAQKILHDDEKVTSYQKAGEGNMNLVMRLQTDSNSIIVKQSRDYVNKYPSIPAPIERIDVEHAFYKEVETLKEESLVKKFSPKVTHFNPGLNLMVMEDLGAGSDFLSVYSNSSLINSTIVKSLVDYLVDLHRLEPKGFPPNLEMRKLNHEHIFNFPFKVENGFNLNDVQEGLQEVSMSYKKDEELKLAIQKVGKRYLSQGTSLLHGDFYPGSWLQVEAGLKVIDPEFAYVGDREFDLGVMLAHFDMALVDGDLKDVCLGHYTQKLDIDHTLLNQYKGIEIMRRLIGIAQLPLNLSVQDKRELLEYAKDLVLTI